MRRYLIIFLLFALGAALFVYTLRDVGLSQISAALASLSGTNLFLVFLAIFTGVIIIAAFKWRMILGTDGKRPIRFYKIFLARLVGYGISYVTPVAFLGGEPASFYMLKEETKFSSARIIGSLIIDKLIFFLATTIFFFVGLFFMLFYLNLSWLMEFICAGLLLLMIFAFWIVLRGIGEVSSGKGFFITFAERFYLNKLKIIKNNRDKLGEIEEEMRAFFKGSKKRILQVFFLAIVELFFVLLSCWLTAFFLGAKMSIPKIFAIKSMLDLSYALPLPAGLGTLEMGQAFLFQTVSSNATTGVVFSLIIRGLNLVISFVALLFFGGVQVKLITRRTLDFINKFLSK